MNFAVVFLFIAMVLAPCVVALWGRLGEDSEEEEALAAAAQNAAPELVQTATVLAKDPLARMVRQMNKMKKMKASRGSRLAEGQGVEVETVPETATAEAVPAAAVAAVATLEDLLQEALTSAREARAASLRADAAASGAAARVATMKADAAAEEARRAHLDADAAEEASIYAQAAYETAQTQAEGGTKAGRTIRLISERRAA